MNAPTQRQHQQQWRQQRQLLTVIWPPATDRASSLAKLWHRTRNKAAMDLRKRIDRLRDRLFYEALLLLLLPSAALLVLLWPGWALVLAVCFWVCG